MHIYLYSFISCEQTLFSIFSNLSIHFHKYSYILETLTSPTKIFASFLSSQTD